VEFMWNETISVSGSFFPDLFSMPPC
jgi:hypothetical protein